MKRSIARAVCMLTAILLVMTAVCFASAEEVAMHILDAQDGAEIIDASGQSRAAGANTTLSSGEIVKTAEGGITKLFLSDETFVILDGNSRVQFTQENGRIEMELFEGTLLLDMRREFGEGESMEIKAGALTANIPGCIVIASCLTNNPAAMIGMLEGTGRFVFMDDSGARQFIDVVAGQKATLLKPVKDEIGAAPEVRLDDSVISSLTASDMEGFIAEQVKGDADLTQRVIEGSPGGELLLTPPDSGEEENNPYPANGGWKYEAKVTLIAQSATKVYDGTPLARPSDVLVYGLPGSFTIQVAAKGSQTNVGSTDNVVSEFSIFNSAGENVTSHFTYIEKIGGSLVVVPATLTVWTGSAEKEYDGEPLTNRKAELKTVGWYTNSETPLRNSAVSVETETGEDVLVAASGRVSVQVFDSETQKYTSVAITPGQQITVGTVGTGNAGYSIEKVGADEIPEELLRLYAENNGLLRQACADAGWDIKLIYERIAQLSGNEGAVVNTVTNSVSVAQSDNGVDFVPVVLDPSIRVTATGSQTEVGESVNTYTIDWGGANSANYAVKEELGTLIVLPKEEHPEQVTLTAGSADKVYDGTPLTNDGVTCSGLASGYTVQATVSGTQTDAGTAENKITGYTIKDSDNKDVTDQFTNVKTTNGTLTVKPLNMSISCGGESVNYNGSTQLPVPIITYTNGAHAGETVNGVRMRSADAVYRFTLFTGDTVDVTVGGGGKNADTYNTTAAVSGIFGNASNFSISVSALSITINPAELVIESPDGSKPYDGTPLKASPAKITGLASGDELFVEITGSQQDVGESDNTFDLIWGDNTLAGNYDVTVTKGKLKVTVNSTLIKIIANSANQYYEDGLVLSDSGFTVEGLPSACSVAANVVGEQQDIGISDNVIESYTIYDSNDNNVTAYFNNIETVNGTLEIYKIISGRIRSITYTWNPETQSGELSYGGMSYILLDYSAMIPYANSHMNEQTDEELVNNLLNMGIIKKP